MRPVVFLDIDGVLNGPAEYQSYHHSYSAEGKANEGAMGPSVDVGERHVGKLFNARCVDVLNSITEKADADIVVSSSWRLFYSTVDEWCRLRQILSAAGVKANILGCTPVNIPDRGSAISAWLRATYEPAVQMVILDDEDESSFIECHPWLVQTDGSTGICAGKDVSDALRILGGKPWCR